MTKHLDISKIISESFSTEAATALRVDVHPRTLHRWIAKGLFPEPVLIRKMRFYANKEVDAWERKRSKKLAVRP
jgi:DNA-binding transcriptional MerR regulator